MDGHLPGILTRTLATLAAAFVLAACSGGDGTATPVGTPIPHASGPRDVLLRYEVGGGLLPSPPPEEMPAVSLFGDGRLVVSNGQGATEVRLADTGIQRLLRLVVDSGLMGQPSFPASSGCADCPTTVISATIDGRSAEVSVYALTIATPEGQYDEAAYRKIEGLARFLGALDARTFQPSEMTGSGPYAPPGYWVRAYPFEAFPPPSSIASWPGGLPALESLLEGGVICGDAAGTFASEVAGNNDPFQDANTVAVVRSRPLLPDDPGADGCTW